MAALSESEDLLKQRIIQQFKDKGTPSGDGTCVELPLKDIWKPLNVEKKAVNRILHNSPCFTKIKDSPPLWQYNVTHPSCVSSTSTTPTSSPIVAASLPRTAAAISTSPMATGTTSHNTSCSLDSEPDVVVKKKDIDSPSKKERLKPGVLAVLTSNQSPMTTLQIAKSIGYETAGDVNPTLYALKDEGRVTKSDNGWSIKSASPSLSSAIRGLHVTPMDLGGKSLYTREDVVHDDGRKESRFREVVTEDLVPQEKETTDSNGGSVLPQSASEPLDDEMLSILSSLFEDAEFHLALQIVNLLKSSGNTSLDDADIFTRLHHTTRLKTRPVLETLHLNGLVERVDGEVVQWKWKMS